VPPSVDGAAVGIADARTIATIPARIAAGTIGQAATRTAKSGSAGAVDSGAQLLALLLGAGLVV